MILFHADLRHCQLQPPQLLQRRSVSCLRRDMNASEHPIVVRRRVAQMGQGSIAESRRLRAHVKIIMFLRYDKFYIQSVASWGMIEIALRTSSRPTLEMSTPSMLIEPDTSSTIRNRATIIDDFPAPVLRVTDTPDS